MPVGICTELGNVESRDSLQLLFHDTPSVIVSAKETVLL